MELQPKKMQIINLGRKGIAQIDHCSMHLEWSFFEKKNTKKAYTLVDELPYTLINEFPYTLIDEHMTSSNICSKMKHKI